MVDDRWTFTGATLLTVAGLAVMLYGVSLTDGLRFNTEMAIGGAIVAVGIGILTLGIGRLEPTHPHD